MKDGKDKYGDFLRSYPAAYFGYVCFLMALFLACVLVIVENLVKGELVFSALIFQILFGVLFGYLFITRVIKLIRYLKDPEEKEKRKKQASLKAAAAQIPANYNPFASSAPAQRSQPAAASNRPNILERYRAARTYLTICGSYNEEKFREMNRLTGNMFSEEDIQKQLAQSKMMIGGMDALKKLHYDSLTEAIATFEEVEAAGIDLSKYDFLTRNGNPHP